MILICYILSIFCKASGDALQSTGRKLWGHPLQLVSSVALVALFILALIAKPDYEPDQIVLIALSYFALRFFLFDYIWNLFAGQYIFYIGNTSYYDLLCQKIAPAMLHFIKVVSGIVIIYCLIAKL